MINSVCMHGMFSDLSHVMLRLPSECQWQCVTDFKDLQQQVLFRTHTGFHITPSGTHPKGEPLQCQNYRIFYLLQNENARFNTKVINNTNL